MELEVNEEGMGEVVLGLVTGVEVAEGCVCVGGVTVATVEGILVTEGDVMVSVGAIVADVITVREV